MVTKIKLHSKMKEKQALVDNRILEAKAIIGLAWTRAKDKNLTLHKPLPPLTNCECFKLGKDMNISYSSLRKLSPKKN